MFGFLRGMMICGTRLKTKGISKYLKCYSKEIFFCRYTCIRVYLYIPWQFGALFSAICFANWSPDNDILWKSIALLHDFFFVLFCPIFPNILCIHGRLQLKFRCSTSSLKDFRKQSRKRIIIVEINHEVVVIKIANFVTFICFA